MKERFDGLEAKMVRKIEHLYVMVIVRSVLWKLFVPKAKENNEIEY